MTSGFNPEADCLTSNFADPIPRAPPPYTLAKWQTKSVDLGPIGTSLAFKSISCTLKGLSNFAAHQLVEYLLSCSPNRRTRRQTTAFLLLFHT